MASLNKMFRWGTGTPEEPPLVAIMTQRKNDKPTKITSNWHDAETWRRNINIHPRGRRRNYVKSWKIFSISNADAVGTSERRIQTWNRSLSTRIWTQRFLQVDGRPSNFSRQTSVSRNISSNRRTPKISVKLIHVCPYNATHLIAERSIVIFTTKFTSIQLPFPLLFPLNAMVPEDRGSEEKRRTPKNSVNSTSVPALVPAQYDGSGGPWQWGEAMKFFVKSTDDTF